MAVPLANEGFIENNTPPTTSVTARALKPAHKLALRDTGSREEWSNRPAPPDRGAAACSARAEESDRGARAPGADSGSLCTISG